MLIDIYLFYLFSGFSIISALMVIGLSNAVHSVLFLILVFCNLVGLMLLLGAEFLSFLFLIVYVGAIAVLFLFVVMMLNVKLFSGNKNFFSIFPISFFIFSVLFLCISNPLKFSFINLSFLNVIYEPYWIPWMNENISKTNVEVIGEVLYTKFGLLFLLSGIILLVAMLGAIVLTMHQRSYVKKQIIGNQLLRNPKHVVKFVNLRK